MRETLITVILALLIIGGIVLLVRYQMRWRTCSICGGSGRLGVRDCWHCRGTGEVEKK